MQNKWKRVWKTILITILIGFSLIVVWHLTKDKDIQEQNNTNDPSPVVGFASCEEVESISEEEISAIVNSDDRTTDYIHDLAYEQNLYGVDLYGAGTEQAEQFRYTCIMLPDGTGVKQKISDRQLRQLADAWNDTIAGADKDAQYIYCGETDTYLEYSVRYQDNRLYYDDYENGIGTLKAYRMIYPKNIVLLDQSDSIVSYFLGELTLERTKASLDIQLALSDSIVLYREYREANTVFECVYYDIVQDDIQTFAPVDSPTTYARLNKNTITIDKETHEMHTSFECIKTVNE